MESDKLVVRRLIDEVWNQGNLSKSDELVDAAYVDHTPVPGQSWQNAQVGVQGFKQVVAVFREAFPDMRITIEQQIGESPYVVSRVTLTGTHKGNFQGLQPTGRRVTATGIRIDQVRNGKIIEHWASFDQLGMIQQLGAIPAV